MELYIVHKPITALKKIQALVDPRSEKTKPALPLTRSTGFDLAFLLF